MPEPSATVRVRPAESRRTGSAARRSGRRTYPDLPGRRRRQLVADLVGTLGIAGLVLVVAMWLANGGIEGLTPVGGVATELGRLSGLISAYLLLLQVIMMARIPWVEGIWGQDVLARRHRLIGFVSFYLMIVHVVAISIGYAQSAQDGIWREIWLLTTDYPGMLLAVAGTVALIAVVALSIRAARRRMRYESWHLIHLYAYIGVGLALPHQLWTGADFSASRLATVFWWGLWGAAAAAIVLWRIGFPILRSIRHALVVEEVVRENAEVISIVMRGRDLDRLGLRAGQFCQWRFLSGPGWTRAHPFTVSLKPTATRVRITIHEAGDSRHDLARVRPGSRVLIEGPYGVMLAHRRTHRDALMIAAGVGLTTMRGLAEEILEEGPSPGPGGTRRPSVTVLHRIRSAADALFVKEFVSAARSADLQIHALIGARSEASGWWGGPRRIDPTAALARAVPDIRRREVYLCGPPAWMQAVRASLRDLDVDAQHIHAEEFGW